MALGDPYATRTELKNRLGVDDEEDDTKMDSALAAATTGINSFTDRQFNKTTTATARRYRPDSHCRTNVHDFHTMTDLVIATDDSDGGTFGTIWSATDYDLEPLDGVVAGEPGWPWWKIIAVGGRWFYRGRRPTVRVTAQWGWPAVPADVHEACLIAAEDLFKLKDMPFGSGGYTDFGIMRVRENPFVVRMLTRYKLDAFLVA
jgi:hypothetical protein